MQLQPFIVYRLLVQNMRAPVVDESFYFAEVVFQDKRQLLLFGQLSLELS
jgi:hypothetical protein